MTQNQKSEVYQILAGIPNVPVQVLSAFQPEFVAATTNQHNQTRQWPKLAETPIRTDRGPYQFRVIQRRERT